MTALPWDAEFTSMRQDHAVPVEMWRAVMRHKALFATVAGFVLILGSGVTMLLPRVYTATATVVVPPSATDPLQSGAAAVGDRIDDDRLLTEAAFLQSRDVAGAVIDQLGPALSKPGPFSGLLCSQLELGCPRPNIAETRDQQIDTFLLQLTVLPEDRSRVLDVSVRGPQAARAAAAANAVITKYQAQALVARAADLDRTVNWLDSRSGELRRRWLEAVRSASTFRVAHGISQTGDAGPALGDTQVAQAAASLGEAQARLAAAAARQTELQGAMRSGDPASIAAVGAQPIVVQQSGTLSMLLAQRAQMAAQLGSGHPDLKSLDQQVASARASLGAASGSALRSVNNDLTSARAEVQQLTQTLQGLQSQAGQQVAPLVEYRTLEQEADSARSVYETFLTRQKELAGRAAILTPPLTFVSHAEIPVRPSAPRHVRLLGATILLALVSGAAAAFLADRMASGFSDVGQLRLASRLPLLSMIPAADRPRGDLRGLIARQPFSQLAESVRTLSVRLAMSEDQNETAQVVTIISAEAKEGKTTLALWLAEIAGEEGKVIVIDGNHRQGAASASFNAAANPGLTELLAGTATLEQVIRRDPDGNVDTIGSGGPRLRPLSQADVGRLNSMLCALRMSHRLVIIDSPALLQMSDALVYAKLADRTVFVCRWRETSREAVMASIDRLHEVGARIAGVVPSMVEPRSMLPYGGVQPSSDSPLMRLAAT